MIVQSQLEPFAALPLKDVKKSAAERININFKFCSHSLINMLTYDTYTKPIYLLQKKVVRSILFKNFSSPSTPIFYDLKILKFNYLLQLKLLTFVYESINLISPTPFHNFFETLSTVHQYDTRQARKGDIFMTYKNTLLYGLRSIRYAGAQS